MVEIKFVRTEIREEVFNSIFTTEIVVPRQIARWGPLLREVVDGCTRIGDFPGRGEDKIYFKITPEKNLVISLASSFPIVIALLETSVVSALEGALTWFEKKEIKIDCEPLLGSREEPRSWEPGIVILNIPFRDRVAV